MGKLKMLVWSEWKTEAIASCPYRIILHKKGKEFVTHIQCDSTDGIYEVSGNYFQTLEDAEKDFETRCSSYGIECPITT